MKGILINYIDIDQEKEKKVTFFRKYEDISEIVKIFKIIKDEKININFNDYDSSVNECYLNKFFLVDDISITLETESSTFALNIYIKEDY